MGILLDSHLIVLDGISGSGKNTTGPLLNSILPGHGLDAHWLPETDISHPLWWYQHWNGTEYQRTDFESTPIDWQRYRQQIVAFLDLPLSQL